MKEKQRDINKVFFLKKCKLIYFHKNTPFYDKMKNFAPIYLKLNTTQSKCVLQASDVEKFYYTR